ncbi:MULTISPECIES: recombination mediator RecR [Holospora]|uniref:Recombination protein RecR n=2 Tax=Holospora TaxID=44747 RepID=A0A061JI99_9PROT|nr:MULTISPECIES: recombination mediator RecR [Holospora]ETZ05342.1 recombination protein RecR [Holospora undulata HU1]GAJ46691.1 recombination protein RecR [Holospora elegans E1]
MVGEKLYGLIQLLSKFPGLGPRSARRIALYLLAHRAKVLKPLMEYLDEVDLRYRYCSVCHYLDEEDPCGLCRSKTRDSAMLCIVACMGDVWALERAAFFKGYYHLLGGLISLTHGKNPEDLNISTLKTRLSKGVLEVVVALDSTIDGQSTLHYLTQEIFPLYPHIKVSSLARGLPMGGELESLDQATLMSAFWGRREITSLPFSSNAWHSFEKGKS